MGFTDGYLNPDSTNEESHAGWHVLSWFAAALLQFALFYFPLRVLGWWAFAFPPWLLIVAAIAPIVKITPTSDPITALIILAVIWVAGAAVLLILGLRLRKFVLVSGAVHMVLTPAMIASAFWLAVQANSGNLPGTS